MVAVVRGKKKVIRLKNIEGNPVGELAQIGFVSKGDFKVLLDNKSLVKDNGKWYLVIHDGIANKEKLKEIILRYIN